MSVVLPIISEFDNRGIQKARQEFSQLETVGQKSAYAIKKAAIPAAAALGAIGVALFDATKGAMEDEAAQQKLALQLKRSTGATDAQVKSVEGFVSAMGKTRAVADDEVRPALAQLVRATNDVTRAQKLFQTAQDISAATGKDLSSVVAALSKAEQGQFTALKKLGIPMGENTNALIEMQKQSKVVTKAQLAFNQALESGDKKAVAKATEKLAVAQERLNAVTINGADYMTDLNKVFGGAGVAAANSSAGGFKKLKIAMDETKESVGAALLPAVQAVLPILTKLGMWAQEHPKVFVAIAAAIAGIAASIMAVNLAMAINPFSLIVIGIGALVAGLVAAYNHFEGFKKVVDTVFGAIKWWVVNVTIPYFNMLWDIVKKVFDGISWWVTHVTIPAFELLASTVKTIFNGIADVWNNTVGKLSFKVPSWIPGLGGKGWDIPDIPKLADGGIVTRPTLALIGEAGAEAVVPLNKANNMGMGTVVNINVNGGDPQQVVNALRRYMQTNGSVPIRVAG